MIVRPVHWRTALWASDREPTSEKRPASSAVGADLTHSQKPALHLRILQTSDLHGALRGHDYLADTASEVIGLTRTATLIRVARAQVQNCLLFDSGDFLQGSPICDFAAERNTGAPHPMITAMNTLGYDAITIGNHDFNHGADFLIQALEQADFPVVSANFHDGPSGPPVFARQTVLTRQMIAANGDRHQIRLAVIGCLPPQTIDWDHHLASRFTTQDMVQSVRAEAATARATGCDLVVVLAHTGIDPSAPRKNAENALIDLAALDNVDVVLGGHTHMVFPSDGAPAHPAIDSARGLIHGKPVLMPGFFGNHLGQVDLVLTRNPDGKWRVTGTKSKLLALSQRDRHGRVIAVTPEDPALLAATEQDHVDTLTYIRQPIGETNVPLHSFFSLLANDNAVQLVAEAQMGYLANAVKDTALDGIPILSSAAPLKTGRRSGPDHYTHIPSGPLSRRNLADLYFYPNMLCGVHLSGAGLRDWLEHSASLFSQITPARRADTALLIDSFPGYKFDVICGLTYQIDLALPPRFDAKATRINPSARRIQNLRWNGKPVSDTQEFLLATNSYRAYGIGLTMLDQTAIPAPEIVIEAPQTNRDILLDFIRRNSPVRRTADKIWSFTPLKGATAIFDTSPLARLYLDDPMLPPLEDLGDTPQGFARFRISL
jgi:2',3'-cyclic-nucleotide 2'-phosphodiesterase/3'-nucleotidase